MDAAPPPAPLKKEALMVHNLQLMGFDVAVGSGSGSSSAVALQPHMFNRPNEKMLFLVLHFLLLRLNPHVEQELKFCWPIVTPHDKSNFKRLVQSVLQELEKQGVLSLGSSHASRLNAGSGPRIVDLVWRLTTQAMKTQLTRDFGHCHLVPVPARGEVAALDAIQLLQARIAMKKRQLQEQFVERSQVQERWVRGATALATKIQETTLSLQHVYEQQSTLDKSINRTMFSQAGDSRRAIKLHNATASWKIIHSTLTDHAYQFSQRVLDTALQHHGDQPVLDANLLRPQRSFSDRMGAVNLTDIVKNADALLQLTRSRLARQDATLLLSNQDQNRMSTLTREANAYITALSTTLQQLRELLVQLRKSNEQATRELCIEMTTESMHDDPASVPLTLCPPTPADKMIQESDLVQSLKKCSMNELSNFAASSVRKSARKKPLELPPVLESSAPIVHKEPQQKEEVRVFRKLQYDFDDDEADHMEF